MKNFTFLFVLISAGSTFLSAQNPTSVKGVSNALQFDGIEDWVSIPNGTGIFANLDAFSMCGWVYPENANAVWPDLDGYFGIKDEGVCDFYIVQLNGTDLEVRITTNQGQFSIPSAQMSQVVPDQWQHFAVVYTGSELQLYYNGVLDGSVAASGTIQLSNLEVTIGKLDYFDTDFFLNGKVDEVTFWDKALTADEVVDYECISGDPSTFPNLIAYYNFNEEEGLVLPDFFGNYDGTLTNMTGSEWTESEVCQSGYDILFTVSDSISGDPVENASINLDGNIKPTDSNGEALYSNYDPGTYPYQVTKNNYYDYAGQVTVADQDTTVDVPLAPVVYYNITYVVTEDPGSVPIDSAIVNMDGVIQYTDETGQTTFTGFLPGSYSYIVLKDGFLMVTGNAEVVNEDVTVEITLLIDAINREVENQIFISPNPVSGKVRISFGNEFNGKANLTLVNFTGQPVLVKTFTEQNPVDMDMSGYPSGIYLLQIETEKIKVSRKLVIQ